MRVSAACVIFAMPTINLFSIMDIYNHRIIKDFAGAVQHLGNLTGVECAIHEVPALKAQGYFSMPIISEDMVRIANKFGVEESVTNEISATFDQFMRIIQALSAKGLFAESEFDRFFE